MNLAVSYQDVFSLCLGFFLIPVEPLLGLIAVGPSLSSLRAVLFLQAWLTEINEFAQQNVVIMLLGNKADATHERVVKREEGEKLAKEYGVPFMETSAKSGLNVELSFTAVAKDLKHREMKEPNEPKFQLQEFVNKEMKGVGCCRS
ncbi:ras-related protein Rab-26-like [Pimephales promelas]|uniref:ras-related protein Rab-26-like n=1 Tax=Pimephales promelas TaxID=90988 RepID=UPI0019558888|nr:ras-related protein Rab-26-like [Pimephales promelas]